MKQNRITVAAMLASLLPTASAMAHSEVTAESGILAAVHHMVKGRYMSRFWFGVLVGLLMPAGLVIIALVGDLG